MIKTQDSYSMFCKVNGIKTLPKIIKKKFSKKDLEACIEN